MKLKRITVVISAMILCVMLSGCDMITQFIPFYQLKLLGDLDEAVVEKASEASTEGATEEAESEAVMSPAMVVADSVYGELSKTEKTNLNKFLSNFSETFYHSPFNESDNEDYEMLSFAYLHNKINVPGNIGGNGKFYTISDDVVDRTLNRYFGRTVPHRNIKSDVYGEYDWGVWRHSDGEFITPAADGESYASFSIATDLIDNHDGTYTALFNVYFDEENMHSGVMSQWYEYSVFEAEAKCSYRYKGEAVVREKVYNNKDTYELISYKTEK